MSSKEGNVERQKPTKSNALQRHHDFYTLQALEKEINPDDLKQMERAIDNRLKGEVEPLITSGVFLVLED